MIRDRSSKKGAMQIRCMHAGFNRLEITAILARSR